MLKDFSIFAAIYNMGVSQVLIKKKIIERIYQNKYRMNLKMRFFRGVQGMLIKKYLFVRENYLYKKSSCL